VIDNRQLTSNGFDLRYRKDASGKISVLEITGMTNLIPGYGLQDLKELLALLMKKGEGEKGKKGEIEEGGELQRTARCVNWLLGEAKRLSGKSAPNIVGLSIPFLFFFLFFFLFLSLSLLFFLSF
jgi:hypothetical protein